MDDSITIDSCFISCTAVLRMLFTGVISRRDNLTFALVRLSFCFELYPISSLTSPTSFILHSFKL